MFKISDKEFKIKHATLDAYIDSEDNLINWGIEISSYTEANDFKEWRPTLKSEVLMATKPDELKSFLDLAGKSISWKERYDQDGEMYGVLYVFEHEPTYDCEIQLRADDASLWFSLSSKCDVNWNEEYSHNLKLIIETKLNFIGIWCGREPENICRKKLEPYFQQDNFKYTKTEHGVSLLKPIEL